MDDTEASCVVKYHYKKVEIATQAFENTKQPIQAKKRKGIYAFSFLLVKKTKQTQI